MANRIHLSYTRMAILIEVSDSEDEVSEYENHTRDETESFYNDFDTINQQMNYKESIKSKNREIKWKLNPLPHFQSTATNIIKATSRVTRYAMART
ncbi:hypothetical protein TNCT_128781 [Trichonephila clavata]|uniref:Uncharacterized protein n=1 Tax=Trichonephila clavata TaxID=2740835 RepID=A0A8X6HRY1_TRICU|nr:hypothetical protein TNCT_128781 [Trichonephila clavata]